MALSSEQSHGPTARDILPPQARNYGPGNGTVGEDQTLRRGEVFPRSRTTENRKVQDLSHLKSTDGQAALSTSDGSPSEWSQTTCPQAGKQISNDRDSTEAVK
ncbi:hypothetical protein JOQ06_002843, partial [Pogonophryne albipinna]